MFEIAKHPRDIDTSAGDLSDGYRRDATKDEAFYLNTI